MYDTPLAVYPVPLALKIVFPPVHYSFSSQHKSQWEIRQREEEIAELQKALSDMQVLCWSKASGLPMLAVFHVLVYVHVHSACSI